jgi:hypothetical protein
LKTSKGLANRFLQENDMSSVRQGWVIGGGIVVLLVVLSTFIYGRGTHYKPLAHAPGEAAQTQP